MTAYLTMREPEYDAMMHALVAGWAKSRAGDEVSMTLGPGYAHCIFTHPIGKASRNRESFYWNCDNILLTSKDFHGENPHFLSVMGVKQVVQENLLTAGYQLLTRETQMYRDVSKKNPHIHDMVRRVVTCEEAEWYNGEKKNNFITNPQSLDHHIYDLYIRQNNIMTSHARAIHRGNYFIIDDVYTHPDYRRKGLASCLLSAINHEASLVNAKTLTLISSNAGIPVYLRNNFLQGQPLTLYSSPNPA